MIRVLVVSSLFPNSASPNLGLFVAERLKHLLSTGEVTARVVAPVPWFPFRGRWFGRYGAFAKTPRTSVWNGEPVAHPRHLVIPGIGWYATPLAMAWAIVREARRLRSEGFDFELIDAHYYFPDGVAAAIAARILDRPVVITARGTDINKIPEYPLARRMIRWAAGQAAASITVSRALRDHMVSLDMDSAKIHVMRNGVDARRFQPVDRAVARTTIGFQGRRLLLSVGYLIERKGHHIVIESLRHLPEWHLIVVGDGEWKARLAGLVVSLGLSDRVTFAGAVSQDELRHFYSAADIVVLASSREGMPNVVLEAIACGTPVAASAVWGTPEILEGSGVGALIDERSAQGVAKAVREIEQDMPHRQHVLRYAETLGWEATTQGQLGLFRRIAGSRPGRSADHS